MSEGDADIADLRVVADYQFGAGVGATLFPRGAEVTIKRSKSGRPRQIIAPSGRIASFTDAGRFTLGLEGGRRLRDSFPERYHVSVSEESDPYVRDGRNAFAKFVTAVDDRVRPGDEVQVASQSGDLLAVGRAELSAQAMRDYETGVAVQIREGAPARQDSKEDTVS